MVRTTAPSSVLEERADAEIALPAPFQEIDARSYGDTKIVIGRAA